MNRTDTVVVEISDFEELVRESERFAMIKDYVQKNKYISKDDMAIFLGIEVEEKEGEE